MSDSIEWAGLGQAAPGPMSSLNAANQGQATGIDLGQQEATLSALHGLNLDDPANTGATINRLAQVGALQQGGALQNLAFTRSLREQIPTILSSLPGVGQSQGQNPQASGSAQDPTQPAPVDAAHSIQTFGLAKGAADQLLALPPDQRPAAFAKIKADFIARGIPEEAIDSAGQHLDDAGLKALSDYYGGMAAHAAQQTSTAATADAPQAPTPHPSSSWYMNAVNNPRVSMMVGLAKSAGLDLSPYLETAKALAMPDVTKQAELNYTGPITSATEGAKAPFEIVHTNINGVPIDMPKSTLLDLQKAGVPGVGVDLGPGPKAEATAAGAAKGALPYDIAKAGATADIAAQHDVLQVPEMDANGQPTGRMVTYRKDAVLNGAAGGRPVGATRSPDEQAGHNADTDTFMTNYREQVNPAAMQADVTARDTAIAGAKLAQSLNPSNLTPKIADISNTLQGLGFKLGAKFDANNLATYQNLAAKNLKDSVQVFPRTQSEFHAIGDAVASAKMPGDAAAIAFTEAAVVRDQQLQQKQFRQQWSAANPGNYSEIAFENAWNKQPQAHQSPFASPLWQGINIDGKPAVKVYPPYTDGHVYAVFLPGTPHASKPFLVK